MTSVDTTAERPPSPGTAVPNNMQKAFILQDLENILQSRFFRNSERGKQFLTYVVQNYLAGDTHLLKERVIGSEVFGRPANYATGEDPVVRVQAGEVRRRLEQYYHSETEDLHVHIELPTGSYTPVFRWLETPAEEAAVPVEAAEPVHHAVYKLKGALPWALAVAGVTTAMVLAAYILWPSLFQQRTVLEQFWAPGFASTQPLLLCVPEPVVYMPTHDFFDRYASAHPGQFATELQRMTEVLPLAPGETLAWKDLRPVKDLGMATGDVYAVVKLTRFLDAQNRKSRLRIGQNYSFEDLRDSPSVLIGAYNNKWATQLTSNLRYRFLDGNPDSMQIVDSTQEGHRWLRTLDEHGQVIRDFGLVTRLLDSKTGQFTVTLGGIEADGTQAAAEFVTDPNYFRQAMRNAPPDWEKKNMEVVIETTVTDMVASPPRMVAAYFW